ncbi:MAG: nucleotidyltransferase domain-containing protein [Candidatus Rokubacteria bacterium]|nr:nucleotidyltransferase domain-containing protein [Candidatus Rokubacteria bacterium]
MTPDPRSTDLAIAEELTRRIRDAVGSRLRKVILLGSRARGDARVDSDFDLLVVLRDLTPGETRPLRLLLYRALRGCGVNAEPWVMSEQEFAETRSVIGGLAYPASTEGVVLYENP